MSKRKAIITAVVAIIALAAVPFIYAQTAGRHHHAGGLMFAHFNRIRAALGLTDDQVTQLKAIREDLRTQNAPYRDQMRGGFAAVAQTLLKDPDNNVAGAQALIDQQSAARKAMQVNVLNAASRALKVLTPEQRAKAAEFLQQRMAMQEQRMQRHDH